jgi:hypothetical protein
MPLSNWSLAEITGNSQYEIVGSTLYVVGNTTAAGQFSVYASTNYGLTSAVVATYTFPVPDVAFDPAVCQQGGVLYIIGTRHNADGTEDIVMFVFNPEGSPPGLAGPYTIVSGLGIGGDYDIVQLAAGGQYVVVDVFSNDTSFSEQVRGIHVLNNVPGSTTIIASSPARAGQTYDALCLLNPGLSDNLELYTSSHPKAASFNDMLMTIGLFTGTNAGGSSPPTPFNWSGQTILLAPLVRFASNHLLVVPFGTERYLAQDYYTQSRAGLAGNMLLGWAASAPTSISSWNFKQITGTPTASYVEPVINVFTDGSSVLAYITRNLTVSPPVDGLVSINALAVPSFTYSPKPEFLNPNPLASWLRGTKNVLPQNEGSPPISMNWGVVGESRGSEYFNETHAISGSPFGTITVAYASVFEFDLGVQYTSNNTSLERVVVTPLQGRYNVSDAGVYTFSPADSGAQVKISYGTMGISTFYSGYSIPPVASINPVLLNPANRVTYYAFSAGGSFDLNFTPLAYAWSIIGSAPGVTLTPSATGVTAVLYVPDSIGPDALTFTVQVAVVDLDQNGNPIHTPPTGTAIATAPVTLPFIPLTTVTWPANFDGEPAWQALTSYTLGTVIFDGTNFQVVVSGGISGATHPAWQTLQYAFAYWQPSTDYNIGDEITDPAGHIQKCTTPGESGSTPPAFNDSGGNTNEGVLSGSPPGRLVWTDQGLAVTTDSTVEWGCLDSATAFAWAQRNTSPTLIPTITQGSPTVSLTYSWVQVGGTPMSTGSTTGTTLAITTNGANIVGDDLLFQLTINDGVNLPVVSTGTVSVVPYLFTTPDTMILGRSDFGTFTAHSNELRIIPATSPYVITVDNPPNSSQTFQDNGVTYTASLSPLTPGAAFAPVIGTPTTGQYNVSSTGSYTFAIGDADHDVLISYEDVTPGTISDRNTAGTWSILSPSATYTDMFGFKQSVAEEGDQRITIVSQGSVTIYGDMTSLNSTVLLSKLLLPDADPGTICDAVHTESDYTIVLTTSGNLYRYGAASTINLDNPSPTIVLSDYFTETPPTPDPWSVNIAYAEGDQILDPNGNIQQVIQDGTSGFQTLNETHTVPVAPYEVAVLGSSNFAGDLGVSYVPTGLLFFRVASDPGVGQYAVTSGGVYTFNIGDLGKAVLISYDTLPVWNGILNGVTSDGPFLQWQNWGVVVAFNSVFATDTFGNVRIVALSGPLGCFIMQFNSQQFTVEGFLLLSEASHLLIGANNVQWVRFSNVESTYSGKVFIGTLDDNGNTFETLIDMVHKIVLGTWSSSKLRNQYVTTGEFLFTPESAYVGVPQAPLMEEPAVLASGAVQLSWIADRPDLITSYQVQYAVNSGDYIPLVFIGTGVTEAYQTAPLPPGYNYSFRVRSNSADGFSPYSQPGYAYVGTPQSAIILTINQISGGGFAGSPSAPVPYTVVLNWTQSNPTEQSVSGYQIAMSTDGGGFVIIATITNNLTSSFIVSGLASGHTYWFQMSTLFNGTYTRFGLVTSVTLPLSIPTQTLPSGFYSASPPSEGMYSYFIIGQGGAPFYAFTLNSGSLPPGITLSNSGLLSGTPTTTGTYSFTVSLTDASLPTPYTALSGALSIQIL